ncbi:MAG: ABC transporter permease [Bacteroidales bacterium]|nr:ABC transporter permease [Bacteroidales bacterium]
MIRNLFVSIGDYLLLLNKTFRRPEKMRQFRSQVITEFYLLGIESIFIIAIISIFMGAAVAMQTAYSIDSPLIPKYTIGYITRSTVILEFSPTIISLILAGKVGSRIAGELGTMRVTEQIDALEVMGINSACYLILPKIVAFVIITPFLIIISMFLGILGGYLVAILTGLFSVETYMFGVHSFFYPFEVIYSLIKSLFFAFIITSVSSYFGYYVSGGALEVGRAGTKAVVQSSVLIIVTNVILTQILLT